MCNNDAIFNAQLKGSMPLEWHIKKLEQCKEYRVEIEMGVDSAVLRVRGPFSTTPDDSLNSIYKNISERQKQNNVGDLKKVIEVSESIDNTQKIIRICVETVATLNIRNQDSETIALLDLTVPAARKMSEEDWAILNQVVIMRFGWIAAASWLVLDPMAITVT